MNGKADGTSGELVRIIVYADQFSLLQKTIASTYTDENGAFSFSPEVDESTFAFIAVGLKKAEFYIKPCASYIFTIPLDTTSETGSIFDKKPLQFTYQADDEGLSDAITEFNIEYNKFLYEYADKIYRGRDKSSIVTFRDKIENQFKDVDNQYFKDYVRYTFASLEWISKMKNNVEILQEYFVDQPVLYQNIQYTEFFSEFFKSYFGYDKVFDYDDLIHAINEGDGVNEVFSLIERDSLFDNDINLRDLIVTNLIAKKYFSADILKDKVFALLEELSLVGSTNEIRNIAGNYIIKLKKLEPGRQAPNFSLKDAQGDSVDLQYFMDRHLLINFVKPDCMICLDHFQLLEELKKQFSNELQIVTIVYGEPYPEVVKYASDRDFRWPVLNLDDNILLLEAYNIRVYPSYVLINPDGSIGMATAPMPDENLDLFIRRQISNFEKKH